MPTASRARTGLFLHLADTDFEIDLTDDGPDDGPSNMRRDEDLLSRAEDGRPGGRVYSWRGLWVSLGFGQTAESSLIDPQATRWVRRPTGGGAVLHGHDVTIAIAIPLRRSVRQSYRLATWPLLEALGALGLGVALAEDVGTERATDMKMSAGEAPETWQTPTVMNARGVPALDEGLAAPAANPGNPYLRIPTPTGLKQGRRETTALTRPPWAQPPSSTVDRWSYDCFAETSKNDIVRVDNGLKVCGCALKRTRRAVLLQASIPTTPPLADPSRTIVGGVSVAPLDIRATELFVELGGALHRILREGFASN